MKDVPPNNLRLSHETHEVSLQHHSAFPCNRNRFSVTVEHLLMKTFQPFDFAFHFKYHLASVQSSARMIFLIVEVIFSYRVEKRLTRSKSNSSKKHTKVLRRQADFYVWVLWHRRQKREILMRRDFICDGCFQEDDGTAK